MAARYICTLWIVLFCGYATAQDYSFHHLTTDDGLLSDLRIVMAEDKNGRIWIASDEGLNVFDGKELTTYSPPDNSGLLYNSIERLFCDKNNTIWIKVADVVQYKRATDTRFSVLQPGNHDIADVAAFGNAPGGGIYLLTYNAIYKVSPQLKITRLKGLDSTITKHGRAMCFYHLKDNTWLLGCGKSIVMIDPEKQAFIKELKYPQAWSICKTSDSTILAGTFGGPLVAHINVRTGTRDTINHYKTNNGKPISGFIGTIAPAGNGVYAMASRFDGVYLVDMKRRYAVNLVHDPGDATSLRSIFCRTLYVTKSRHLFVHTKGLSYTSLNRPQLNTVKKLVDAKGELYDEGYNCFMEGADSTMWLGTNRFLAHWDRKTGVSKYYPYFNPKEKSPVYKTIRSIQMDKKGRVWVAAFSGGLGMLKADGTFELVWKNADSSKTGLPSRGINAMTRDAEQNFMISTAGGFVYFNPVEKKFYSFKNHRSLKKICNKMTYYAYEDRDANWWFCQEDGLAFYDKRKDTVIKVQLPDVAEKNVFAVAEDKQGRIYAGGKGGVYIIRKGIYKYHTVLGKKDGLISEYIISLQCDKHGDMWIVGNRGIARYNLPEKQLEIFNANDGAEQGNHSFCSTTLNASGEVFIGSIDAFNHFYPENIKAKKEKLNVFIASVELQDTVINFPGNKPLKLKYFQNNISFNYQAVDYSLAPSVQYRYRMQGFDSAYVYAGTQHKARYANLPAGNYTFVAEASANGRDWDVASPPISFTISMAFWKTYWFRAGLLLLLAGGLYAWYRYRITAIRKQAKIRTDYEVKMNEMENSALRTQMNPHFIFNSLNTINAFINANDNMQANQYISKFSKLIRLILDHSRQKKISMAEELESLKLYVEIERIRFENKFEWLLKVDPAIDPSNTEIPSLIIQPFVENAILHGLLPKGDDGILKVEWKHKDGYLLCTIEDNGIGREKARMAKNRIPVNRKSHGLDITLKRIEFFNMEHGLDSPPSTVTDLYHPDGSAAGTRVEVFLACVERF